MQEQIKFQMMPIDQLVEYKLNAKLHPPAQVKQIENSIKKFGMNDPIGIDEKSKVVIEGHGRLMACRNLGIKEVPVISLGHLDEKQQRAYRLAHNKINMNSGMDNQLLADEIISINEIDVFIDSGFSEIEIGKELGGGNIDESAFPDLDGSATHDFARRAFTVSINQSEIVDNAIAIAKKKGHGVSAENGNTNGNALAHICEQYNDNNS